MNKIDRSSDVFLQKNKKWTLLSIKHNDVQCILLLFYMPFLFDAIQYKCSQKQLYYYFFFCLFD